MNRFGKIWQPVYETNDNDALIPELWAQEALRVLDRNLIVAQLVHRDFEDAIASFGDVVNAHRPASFVGKRKTDADDVTVQNATATNVPVLLNQHLHTSFRIRDGEASKSFKNLSDMYLERAVMSIAQMIEQIVLGQVYEFLANTLGKIGTALTAASIVAVREKFNTLLAPMDGRNLLLTPAQEGDLLAVDNLVTAEKVGDDGSALRNGNIGTKYGINMFMSQNVPSIAAGSTVTVTTLINQAAAPTGYFPGDTALTVDGGSTNIPGSWCTIAGDDTPQLITAEVGGAGACTQITISPGLRSAVANDAIVTVYTPSTINLGAGYDVGYSKELATAAFGVAPKNGQLFTTGIAGTYRYSALPTPTTTAILLNRALDAALVNGEVAALGPKGDYGFAFHRDAIALVTRPLALPIPGAGAVAAVLNYNGLSMRVCITYSGVNQGHLVTIDMLCGVKTLDTSLGIPLLA